MTLSFKKTDTLYAVLCCVWLFLGIAFIDEKVSLPFMGGSEGSTTTGANPYVGEFGAMLLGLMVLVFKNLHNRVAPWAKVFAVAWWSVFVLAAVLGLRNGHSIRAVLVDGRFALGPLYLVLLLAIPARFKYAAAWSAILGATLFLSVRVAVTAAEPTGWVNLNVIPLSVLFYDHNLSHNWLLVPLGLLAVLGSRHPLRWPVAAVCFWMVVLSFSRSLWLGVMIAAGVTGIFLGLARARRVLRLPLLVGLLSVAGSVLAFAFNEPDGRFLLRFRAQGLCATLKLCEPMPLKFSAPSSVSPGLKRFASGGSMFTHLGNKVDASVFDRSAMARTAVDAWKKNMIFGQGLGYLYRYDAGHYNAVMNNPHNGYLWVLSKTGLLGALTLAGFMLWGLVCLWRRIKKHDDLVWLVYVLAFVASLEMMQSGLGEVGVMLPLCAALTLYPDPGKYLPWK